MERLDPCAYGFNRVTLWMWHGMAWPHYVLDVRHSFTKRSRLRTFMAKTFPITRSYIKPERSCLFPKQRPMWPVKPALRPERAYMKDDAIASPRMDVAQQEDVWTQAQRCLVRQGHTRMSGRKRAYP